MERCVHDLGILIKSCDSYSDLWHPFFTLWSLLQIYKYLSSIYIHSMLWSFSTINML